MVGLREPRTPTYHWMVLGVLRGDGVTRYRACVKGWTTWSIREEKGRKRQIEGDLNFRYMQRKIKKLSRNYRSTLALWIPDKTLKIAD